MRGIIVCNKLNLTTKIKIMKCENCGANVPKVYDCSDGRKVCCPGCIFHPLGCRCRYGELGVNEEFFFHEEEDDYDDPDNDDDDRYFGKY